MQGSLTASLMEWPVTCNVPLPIPINEEGNVPLKRKRPRQRKRPRLYLKSASVSSAGCQMAVCSGVSRTV